MTCFYVVSELLKILHANGGGLHSPGLGYLMLSMNVILKEISLRSMSPCREWPRTTHLPTQLDDMDSHCRMSMCCRSTEGGWGTLWEERGGI